MSSPVEETIAGLVSSDRSLANSRLDNLSHLNSEEEKLFEQAWAGVKPELRCWIVQQLVELAEDNVELDFGSIFRYCLGDADAGVRSKAIDGLWESEDASLIDPLAELLAEDNTPEVQVAAATGLGKFALLAEFNKVPSCYKSRLEQSLLTAVADKTRPITVRARSLEAVAPLSLPRVIEAIRGVYESGDPELKLSAIRAMGGNCDSSWIPILLTELASHNAEIRYEAAEACGEIGEEEAVPYLIQLVDDIDSGVALAAIQALGKIGGSEARRCLEQCLNDPEELVQQAAAQALGEIEAGESPLSFGV